MEHRHDILEVITYSPILVLVCFGMGIVLHEAMPVPLLPGTGMVLDIIGIAFLILGTFLLVQSESVRREFFHPETDATCYDFFRGPYKLSRHPGYVAFVLLYLGFALVLNSLPAVLLTLPLIATFSFLIIPREEKLLRQACSESYDAYCKRVRMWL